MINTLSVNMCTSDSFDSAYTYFKDKIHANLYTRGALCFEENVYILWKNCKRNAMHCEIHNTGKTVIFTFFRLHVEEFPVIRQNIEE